MKSRIIAIVIAAAILFSAQACKSSAETSKIFEKGLELYTQEKLADALIEFDKVISYTRKNKQAFFMKAKCEFYLGKPDEAKKTLLKTLKRFPNYTDALMFIAKIHYFAHEFEDAKKYLHLLIQEDSLHYEGRFLLGEIYMKEGNYDKALINYYFVEQQIDLIALSYIRKAEIYTAYKQIPNAVQALSFIDNNKALLDETTLSQGYDIMTKIMLLSKGNSVK